MKILDKFRMDGRVAIVTGGAGLLGAEFCRSLAEAGAHVIAADVNLPAVEKVAAAINAAGLSAEAVQVDVTSPDSTRAMVDAALKKTGKLDAIVNSAALDPKVDPTHKMENITNFEDYPLSQWQQGLDVNLTGMFLCCQAASRAMLAQNSGSIINICSTYGLVGPDQRIYERPGEPMRYKPVFYSVTKAGVLGLTRYLATYFAGKPIRCNAVTPGGVYNNNDELFVQNYSARTVLGRMARKDELSGAILYLASEASSYMTGSNVVVDGGWTAW